MAIHYYLAPWVWNSGPNGYWKAPAGTLGRIDFRPIPAQALQGGAPNGFGYFAIDSGAPVPADGYRINRVLGASLTNTILDEIASRLNLVRDDIQDSSHLNVLWNILTVAADPTGDNGVKPLMPGVRGQMELHLGGHSMIKTERFDRAKHPFVRRVLQRNYQLSSTEPVVNRDLNFSKAQLAAVQRKYGYKPNEIAAPSGGATITDDFNRVDSATLGGSWTEVVTDLEIVSNTVRNEDTQNSIASCARARWDADLDSDDHYAQIDAVNQFNDRAAPGSIVGANARWAAAADTSYAYIIRRSGGGLESVYKIVTGTPTDLGTEASFTVSLPHEVKVEINGSTLRGLLDTVEKQSVTDTAITGNTRAGFMVGERVDNDAEAQGDDFEAADLAAPAAGISEANKMLALGKLT